MSGSEKGDGGGDTELVCSLGALWRRLSLCSMGTYLETQREAAELLKGPRVRPVPVGCHDCLFGVHTAFLSDLRMETTSENNNWLSDPLIHSQCSQQLGRVCGR